VDLTGLPAEQLSSRPSLHAFLDALRDRQRIPEPKDYKSWRMKIAKLEAGAADGTFEETWHLPTGQTFRVTGRPHPDGAVAYLFEDISVEVSMTRSYRSEIELSQSVVDSLDIAIAAFAENGHLQLSNAAYRRLWNQPDGVRLSETSIEEATAQWAELCQPDESFEALRAAARQRGAGQPWRGEVVKRDGTRLRCDLRPVAGGAILVTFTAAAAADGDRVTLPQLARVLSL
jgi:PAS domain-containing protein